MIRVGNDAKVPRKLNRACINGLNYLNHNLYLIVIEYFYVVYDINFHQPYSAHRVLWWDVRIAYKYTYALFYCLGA